VQTCFQQILDDVKVTKFCSALQWSQTVEIGFVHISAVLHNKCPESSKKIMADISLYKKI